MKNWIKRILLTGLIGLIAIGFYLAMREKPTPVDIANVARHEMQVTIDEEGVTQVRDVYTVSSPVAGHLARITLDEGDAVKARDTVIASIHPLDPPFLDLRTEAELQAAVEAARSSVAVANVERQRAQTSLTLAQSDFKRLQKLAKDDLISDSQLERSFSDVQLAKVQVESASANIRLREAELNSVKARMVQPASTGLPPTDQNCCVDITSPTDGVVLKIKLRSEAAVAMGTPIADIGDPRKLDIVVDLLSSDAVRVKPGAQVSIIDWGGDETLFATVRRIDPAAFTRLSALGIEEQRVNTYLDLIDVPPGLGHGYRVFARVTIWSSDSAMQVPMGAVFRSDGEWAVFVIEDGRARLRLIKIGHMNATHVEIINGLADNDRVIMYPSDVLEDGRLVQDRAGQK